MILRILFALCALASPLSSRRAPASAGGAHQLALLQSMPSDTLAELVKGGKPDHRGMVGHNRSRWMGAQYQRGAALYLMYAASRGDQAAAEDAWRALEVAFAHQRADGGFGSLNESGTPSAMKDVYSDNAFWLAQLCQAVFVVRASPLAEAFRGRVDALVPQIRSAATLMEQGREVLVSREARSPNRYFIDAVAFGLSGLLLGDRALQQTGASFVDLGLASQRDEGYFEEGGGWDTSYNCVSIWQLQIFDLYFPTPRHEEALARAVRWQLQHVDDDGAIDVTGNARTGLGQERYFGKSKQVNYTEAVLALLYYGHRHQNRAALDAARRAHHHRVPGCPETSGDPGNEGK